MSPLKAPGPDGFQPIFFQHFWNIVGANVIKVALNCLNEGILPKEVNKTLIVLIPKVSTLEHLSQFQPISLCNVIYKAITKSIVNRLKPFLSQMVAPTKSSFLPGRNMADNVIVYQEVLHSFKTRRGGKADRLIKLDLVKAYDRLRWSFIKDTLQQLGVLKNLITAIMACVSSSTFRVLWNGEKTEEFHPTRGLR